jgi:hypothetical protein
VRAIRFSAAFPGRNKAADTADLASLASAGFPEPLIAAWAEAAQPAAPVVKAPGRGATTEGRIDQRLEKPGGCAAFPMRHRANTQRKRRSATRTRYKRREILQIRIHVGDHRPDVHEIRALRLHKATVRLPWRKGRSLRLAQRGAGSSLPLIRIAGGTLSDAVFALAVSATVCRRR